MLILVGAVPVAPAYGTGTDSSRTDARVAVRGRVGERRHLTLR